MLVFFSFTLSFRFLSRGFVSIHIVSPELGKPCAPSRIPHDEWMPALWPNDLAAVVLDLFGLSVYFVFIISDQTVL